ncbi:hypothetical protein OG943_47225 [Amycolatopsis sp. NBC_00345]|uniref:hypothetical protein n=1 Tax=Amycolatopsis sp. NBC_00345 TaxID=2975955 RepID=UPI002E263E98
MDWLEAAKLTAQQWQASQPPQVPIDQIVQQLQQSDSSGWQDGVDLSHGLATKQEALSQQMTSLMSNMESSWQGEGADLARSRMQKMRDSMIDAHQTFLGNEDTHAAGLAMHENLRNQIAAMPPKPSLAPGQTVGFTNVDMLVKSSAYIDAAQKNLDTYNAFATESQSNSGQLRADYGVIGKYDGGDVSLAEQPPAKPPVKPTSHGPSEPSGGYSGPPRTQGPGGPNSPTSSPNGPRPGYRPQNVPVASGPDNTTTSSYQPPNLPGGSGGSGPGNAGGFGSGGSGTFGPGGSGGFDPVSGFGPGGSAGGFGPGGSGSGGSGSGGQNGAGARSGIGGNEPGAAGARGPGAGGAASARNGSPGMGGGMGRGGKKGEEDAEHERKYVLDVDLFADEKTAIDPETGFRPVPPTLGT